MFIGKKFMNEFWLKMCMYTYHITELLAVLNCDWLTCSAEVQGWDELPVEPVPDVEVVDGVGPEVLKLDAVDDRVRHGHHHPVAETQQGP